MSSEYVPVALRQQVFERAQGMCEYCRSKAKYAIDALVIDHIERTPPIALLWVGILSLRSAVTA
jgi:hypothetical protein